MEIGPTRRTVPTKCLVDSGRFDGLSADVGRTAIVEDLMVNGQARPDVTYRLRDWLVSRQRPWGAPIPVVYCETDGIVPVPDDQLPIVLPDNFDYSFPGSNPLLGNDDFVNTTCPKCGKPARRETDTMDTFVDSAWYWWRYLSPNKEDRPHRPRARGALVPGRPVHRRLGARGNASAVRALHNQGA